MSILVKATIRGGKYHPSSVRGILLLLLMLVGGLPTFAQQQCGFNHQKFFFYTEPANTEALPVLAQANLRELPQVENQQLDQAPGIVTRLSNGIGVSSLHYDAKANVLYYSVLHEDFRTSTIFADPLPINSGKAVVIAEVEGFVKSIVTDYVNRDRVYLLSERFLPNFGSVSDILAFQRGEVLGGSVSMQAVVLDLPITGVEQSLVHIPSSTDNTDYLALVAYNNAETTGPHLYVFDPTLGSTQELPEPTIAELDGGFTGYDLIASGFNPALDDLYLLFKSIYSGASGQYLVQRVRATAPTKLDVNDVSPFFDAQNALPCQPSSLAVSPASSLDDVTLTVNCNQPFSELRGVLAFSGNVVGGELGSIASRLPFLTFPTLNHGGQFYPLASSGTATCCQPGSDSDVDRDGAPDCNDLCQKVAASKSDQLLSGLDYGCPCLDRQDQDFDGLLNCQEQGDTILVKTGGVCVSEGDADSDGVENCDDLCPLDSIKSIPGQCGCEILESALCSNACLAGFFDSGCGCGIDDCSSFLGQHILTNRTGQVAAPVVELVSTPDSLNRTIRISFEKFDGVQFFGQPSQLARLANQEQLDDRGGSSLRRERQRLTVRYQFTLRQVINNQRRVVLRRTVRANSVLVRRLSSGLYVAKYRAMIVRRRRDTNGQVREQAVHRTAFSPAQTFSL